MINYDLARNTLALIKSEGNVSTGKFFDGKCHCLMGAAYKVSQGKDVVSVTREYNPFNAIAHQLGFASPCEAYVLNDTLGYTGVTMYLEALIAHEPPPPTTSN